MSLPFYQEVLLSSLAERPLRGLDNTSPHESMVIKNYLHNGTWLHKHKLCAVLWHKEKLYDP